MFTTSSPALRAIALRRQAGIRFVAAAKRTARRRAIELAPAVAALWELAMAEAARSTAERWALDAGARAVACGASQEEIAAAVGAGCQLPRRRVHPKSCRRHLS